MKTKPLVWMCLISALLPLYSCGPNPSQATADSARPEAYRVATVAGGPATIHRDYPARLEGRQNVEIRPKVDGFVEKIFVDEGARVKKGQLLFRIHAPQYEQEVRTAAAAVERAEAEVNTATMQVEKTVPLVQEGIISAYELKAAELTLEARKAALAQARAGLINARNNLGYTQIRSPVDGMVGDLPYKTGSLVSSTSPRPLTTVSDIGEVFAYFSWNEKQFLEFTYNDVREKLSDKIRKFPEVTLVLADRQEYARKGTLETVGGLIDPATGSVRMRALFANPEGVIRSGASAVIRVPVNLKEALLVPLKATYEMQDRLFVYVVDDSGVVKSTEIEVNEVPAGEYYIVEKGVRAGDRVVTEGLGSLKEGMKITPKRIAGLK